MILRDPREQASYRKCAFKTLNSSPMFLVCSSSSSRLSVSSPHHDSGDDGDERITVGEQAVRGLCAAVSLLLRRRQALQEGIRVIPRFPSLLHFLVIVVLDYFAFVVFSHDRGGVWCHCLDGAGMKPQYICLQTPMIRYQLTGS